MELLVVWEGEKKKKAAFHHYEITENEWGGWEGLVN